MANNVLDWGRDGPTNSIRREFRRKRYLYANGNIKYECFHTNRDAAETVTDWEIIKYSQDGNDYEGPQNGAVNTESVINALSWNI